MAQQEAAEAAVTAMPMISGCCYMLASAPVWKSVLSEGFTVVAIPINVEAAPGIQPRFNPRQQRANSEIASQHTCPQAALCTFRV